MSLTPQDIARIANLARLELQPEESERMLTQINGFFSIVQAMQAVDTTGITPMAHPVAAIQDAFWPVWAATHTTRFWTSTAK
jgi:aspartyl-tRNA(Asn)/glutamyl-tRNA(Gln) amidotransferase subunit C